MKTLFDQNLSPRCARPQRRLPQVSLCALALVYNFSFNIAMN